MRAVGNNFARIYQYQSELVLRSLPQFCEPHRFEKVFKDSILNNKNLTRRSHELFIFPFVKFKLFSKGDVYKLLRCSHDILKSKGLLGIEEYNSLIKSYLIHDIDIDICTLLNEIKNNNMQPNNDTYKLIIMLYCRRGDMTSAESLLNILKSRQENPDDTLSGFIYSGFIKSGENNKADKFLKDENIDENNIEILKVKALAYAEIKRFSDVIELLEKMRAIDEMTTKLFVRILYTKFVMSGASKSELDQLITIGDITLNPNFLKYVIFNLNRSGFYNNSLDLILRAENQRFDKRYSTEVVESFNKSDCPLNVYKTVLEHFRFRLYPTYSHLFLNTSFGTAIHLSEVLIHKENEYCILSSLIKKGFETKSIDNINEALQFGMRKSDINIFNVVMEFVFIPSLFESDIVAEPTEIIPLLPLHKYNIMRAFFIHYLCHGDFASFNDFLKKYPTKPQPYLNFSKKNFRNFLSQMSINQLDEFYTEASKVFDRNSVHILTRNIIMQQIIQSSRENDENGIKDSVEMSKKLGVSFSSSNLQFLKDNVKSHMELIEELEGFKPEKIETE